MNKLIAAIVASTFILGSTTVIAATAVKKEELTQEQRGELRNRADRLVQERAQNPAPVRAAPTQAPAPVKAHAKRASKAKALHAKKTKKVSRHNVKKTAPTA